MHFTEVLKLRGLPYSVTKEEIVKFFGEEFDLKEGDINVCYQVDGKATGEAFVKFSSSEMSKKAMNWDGMTIGARYVEVFACKKSDCYKAVAAEVSIFLYSCLIFCVFPRSLLIYACSGN